MPVKDTKRAKPRAKPQEVLTLSEAAAYLRVREADLAALAATGGVPARQIAGEWRLSRRGLEDWLCGGRDVPPRPGSKEAVLRHDGVFRGDNDLEERLADARARREAGG